MKELYVAHTINTYGTKEENILLERVDMFFGDDWKLVNPNQKQHAEGYRRYKETHGDAHGMRYFTEEVLPACDGIVFMPFRDGRWPAGIAKEVQWFLRRGLPVWRIALDGDPIPVTTMPHYKVLLSVEETRSRLRDADGNMRPY